LLALTHFPDAAAAAAAGTTLAEHFHLETIRPDCFNQTAKIKEILTAVATHRPYLPAPAAAALLLLALHEK
jgi:hypothetical protein